MDDLLAEAKPKDKMDLIKREQAEGKLVTDSGPQTHPMHIVSDLVSRSAPPSSSEPQLAEVGTHSATKRGRPRPDYSTQCDCRY